MFYIIYCKLISEIEVNHYAYAKTTQSGGIIISKLKVTPAPLRKNIQIPATLERHTFIPYFNTVNIKTVYVTSLIVPHAIMFIMFIRLTNYQLTKSCTLWLVYSWKTLEYT